MPDNPGAEQNGSGGPTDHRAQGNVAWFLGQCGLAGAYTIGSPTEQYRPSGASAVSQYDAVAAVLNEMSRRFGERCILAQVTQWQAQAEDELVRPKTSPSPALSSPSQARLRTRSAPMLLASSSALSAQLVPSVGDPSEPMDDEAPPEGEIAFVFTDIADSTTLWEQVTDSMNEALSLHNQVLRNAVAANQGYEVKTIGDAFMVAFRDPVDAVRFCLDVQEELNVQDWPEELGGVQQAATISVGGTAVQRGLRVRMGCHFGHALKETNPLTGRADYRGPTVNVAARVEGQGVGGLVTITDVLLETVSSSLKTALGDPMVRSLGKRTLKGVVDPVYINAMAPRSLAKRLDFHLGSTGMGKRRGSRWVEASRKAMLQAAAVPGLGRRMGVKLRKTRGTLCALRPQYPDTQDPDAVSEDVAAAPRDVSSVLDAQCSCLVMAEVAVAETEGLLEGSHGDSVLCSWNTLRACSAHVQQAIRFAAIYHRKRNGEILPPGFGNSFAATENGPLRRVLAGIATGRVHHGSVGSHRRCHRAVVGLVARTAFAATDYCSMLRTLALLVGRVGNEGGTMKTYLRTIDRWCVGSSTTLIEDVDVGGVLAAEEEFGVWDFLADGEAAGMGGGEVTLSPRKRKAQRDWVEMGGYEPSFSDALNGDADAIRQLSDPASVHQSRQPDLTLRCVAALLEDRKDALASAGEVTRNTPLCLAPPALCCMPGQRLYTRGGLPFMAAP